MSIFGGSENLRDPELFLMGSNLWNNEKNTFLSPSLRSIFVEACVLGVLVSTSVMEKKGLSWLFLYFFLKCSFSCCWTFKIGTGDETKLILLLLHYRIIYNRCQRWVIRHLIGFLKLDSPMRTSGEPSVNCAFRCFPSNSYKALYYSALDLSALYQYFPLCPCFLPCE